MIEWWNRGAKAQCNVADFDGCCAEWVDPNCHRLRVSFVHCYGPALVGTTNANRNCSWFYFLLFGLPRVHRASSLPMTSDRAREKKRDLNRNNQLYLHYGLFYLYIYSLQSYNKYDSISSQKRTASLSFQSCR